MTRLTPLTAAGLAKKAEVVSDFDRPEPPKGQVIYRCGHVIYRVRAEWRTACASRKAPHGSCACNLSISQRTAPQEVAA